MYNNKTVATRLFPNFKVIIINTCVIKIEHLKKILVVKLKKKRNKRKILQKNIWSFTSYLPLNSKKGADKQLK